MTRYVIEFTEAELAHVHESLTLRLHHLSRNRTLTDRTLDEVAVLADEIGAMLYPPTTTDPTEKETDHEDQ